MQLACIPILFFVLLSCSQDSEKAPHQTEKQKLDTTATEVNKAVTNLVGDFLFVEKLSYGKRIPMSPMKFPIYDNRIKVKDSTDE